MLKVSTVSQLLNNVVSAGAAAAEAAPLVAVILIDWAAGMASQWAMGKSGADKAIGDRLKKCS